MNNNGPLKPIVVGIDGSQAAIEAAKWAVGEAIGRELPLRLVYVATSTHPSSEEYYREMDTAQRLLRQAHAAVDASGEPVKVESAILNGPPGASLVAESRKADMVCVGATGLGRYARALLGSAASELAEKAQCPVAIVRSQHDEHEPKPEINWIVVGINDAPDDDAVIERAMAEAKLRAAPVLAVGEQRIGAEELDRRLHRWKQRHSGVHIYPIAAGTSVRRFLQDNDLQAQLAVIGGSDADQLDKMMKPRGRTIFRHPEPWVVMIVRR